jgi:acyl-CoA thioester hydrolase
MLAAMFAVRLCVRSYEIDFNGHVNHANYHRYAEHSRMEHLVAAGATVDAMAAHGVGIVLLETHVRFLSELLVREEIEVDSRLGFGEGRTFAMDHTITRVATGAAAAELACRMGMLDLGTRRLVADPAGRLREVATHPDLLGL